MADEVPALKEKKQTKWRDKLRRFGRGCAVCSLLLKVLKASIQYALVSEVLKWFVLASILALGYAEGRPKKGRSFTKTPCWTLLDIGNVILVLAAAALAAFKGYILTWMHWSHPHDDVHILREGLASISVAVSLVIIAVITILRIELVLGPSGFICSLLGLLVTATITDVFQLARLLWNRKQEILPSDLEIQDSLVVATTVLAVVMFGNFVGSGICDAVFWRSSSSGRKAEEQLDEDDFSVFGKTFCVALYPLLKGAMKPSTKMDDVLPALRRSLCCRDLVKKLYDILKEKYKTSERRRHFVGAMLRVLWLDVFWVGITFISYYASLIARIPILESLVNGDNRTEIGNLVFLFTVTCLAEFLLSSYSMQLTLVFGSRIRSMLQGAIFKKVTRLSPTALSYTSPGQVASMLAVDCFQISMSMFLFPTPLAGILCMPVLLWQLSIRVGTVPTLWCAAWFVLVFLLPFPASRLQKALWIRNVRARDERLKRMGDLLSSIRLVKMYAWEKPHRERVEEARGEEMTAMFFINLLDGIIDSLYSAISSVLIIIVFGTLSIVDPTRTLTPGMSFTCVYILSVTDIINTAAALFLRNRSQVSLALRRIVDFCTEEEQDERPVVRKDHPNRGTVALTNCSFAWTSKGDGTASAVLKDVSLIVEPGSLVGVVGFVGTGKSSLMAAILGDMHCLKGASNVVGRVGYVSQMPSVHNMTIRDNILYGEKMDRDRYEHVLSACQLTDDLNRLPAGDLTEVGEKGETLSGGQKQRLALARAAYNQCDIYLLDDPLSALDPNVARKVFQKVVSNDGILRNKTRILVTNQGDLLCHMDQLLLVHDNSVSVYFSVVDLLDDPRVPETIRLAFSASVHEAVAEKRF